MITAKEFFENNLEGRFVLDFRDTTTTGRLVEEYDIIDLMEKYYAERSGRYVKHRSGTYIEYLESRLSEAETLINHAVDLMDHEQLSSWTGVRAWLEAPEFNELDEIHIERGAVNFNGPVEIKTLIVIEGAASDKSVT